VNKSDSSKKRTKTAFFTLNFAITVALATLPIAGLITARTLTPSPQGIGTHQQLGLPPCSMRIIFGIRCPGCGMTTSWSYFTRGEFRASLNTNFGGFLFAALGAAISAIAIAQLCRKRPLSTTIQRAFSITAFVIFLISLIQWGGRLLL
jgi:hypothetical protein